MESVGLEAALQPSNVMVMRGSDLVLAVGNEIRIANVVDAKATGTSQASYKVSYPRRHLRLSVANFTEGLEYAQHHVQHQTNCLEPRRKIPRGVRLA